MNSKHLLYGELYSSSFTTIDKARLNLTYIDTIKVILIKLIYY